MASTRQPVRLRIRTRTDDPTAPRWIIGRDRYNVPRAHRDAETLRQAGHVVHVDLAEWYR